MNIGFSAHSSKIVEGIPDKDAWWYVVAWGSVEACYWYFQQPTICSMPIRLFEIPIYVGALKKPEVYSIRRWQATDRVIHGSIGTVTRSIPPVDLTQNDIIYIP